MEINYTQAKIKQNVIEKVYTRYYLSLLTYGSDEQISAELGSDILALHKKTSELRKGAFEKRREERVKAMEERRAQREAEREERSKRLEEKKEARRKEREAIALARNLPISVLAEANLEEEEEEPSDEE